MTNKKKFHVRDMVYIAIFAALTAICSWIFIPTTIPFTLQTFSVFLTMGLLGGKRGTLSIVVFILLAAVGAPVLAGFTGGIGVLLGSTGGYILGFLLTALIIWLLEARFGNGLPVLAVGMALGLAACYAFGTLWYMAVYTRTEGAIGLITALGWCVLPYIIPDLAKLGAALWLTKYLRRFIK